jgi:hypothetical protein
MVKGIRVVKVVACAQNTPQHGGAMVGATGAAEVRSSTLV